MELNKDFEIKDLVDYDFIEMTKEYKEEYISDEDPVLNYFEGYLYNIGHSRRGQHYYLLCNTTGSFSLYASEPDGAGGQILMPGIILKLIEDKVMIN